MAGGARPMRLAGQETSSSQAGGQRVGTPDPEAPFPLYLRALPGEVHVWFKPLRISRCQILFDRLEQDGVGRPRRPDISASQVRTLGVQPESVRGGCGSNPIPS